jgi:Secretion system C-terminal sorting domain
MFKRKNILVFLFLIISHFQALSQSFVINWQKSVGGERNEVAYASAETSDGGFIVVGSTNSKNSFDVKDSRGFDGAGGNDFWITKIGVNGTLDWSKTFGGSKDDVATGIVKTANGEYAIIGTTQSTDGDAQFNGTNGGLLMVRLKENGDLVSKRLFAGGNGNTGASYLQTNSFSKPSIKLLSNGSLMVAASRSVGIAPFSGYDFYLAMLSQFGDTLWEKVYGGGLEDYLNDFIPTSDGGFLMVGGTLSLERDIPGAGQGFLDFLAIKADASGRLVWKKGFGGTSYDVCFSVLENSAKNGFYLVGESSSSNAVFGTTFGEKDGIILKIDKDGNFTSKNRFGGIENEGFYNIIRGADNVLYCTGTSQSEIGAVKTKGPLTDVWLMALNESTFVPDYHKLYGGADIDLARQVIYTSKKGLFLAGSSRSTDGDATLNRGASDFWGINLTPPPPIIFGKFQAVINEYQEIETVWTTTYENKSQFIYIEKSENNKDFFQKDEIFAAGASNTTKTYKYVDKNAIIGKNYYRLRYTDEAGKYYNGPTLTFTFSPLATEPIAPKFNIYPNPAKDFVIIESEISDPQFGLFDSNGRSQTINIEPLGEKKYKINLSNEFPFGLYNIRVSNQISSFSKKIIINK